MEELISSVLFQQKRATFGQRKIMVMPSSRFLAVLLATGLQVLICCTQSFAQISAMVPKVTTRAVVIGVSNYPNIPKLRFAHRDAEAFAEYLRAPAGGNTPAENIRLLTNEKATYPQIISALSWLIAESSEGDLAIIYFSGHGDVETQITKEGYLLAYDVYKNNYAAGGALSIHSLQRAITNLSQEKQVQILLIADACRSGNMAGSETNGSKTTALALATQFDKEIKILSCGAEEVSHEGEDWGGGHSVFSYYLLKGLRGLADVDEDRRVNLREIERFLEDSVRRATINLDRRQTPATYGSKDRVIAKVDPTTLAALRQNNQAKQAETSANIASKSPEIGVMGSDSIVLGLYHDFEEALRTGHLLQPEKGAAYSIYLQIKDHPAMRPYKNLMRNDLAASLQEEVQKAIKDYLSADPREMRRRWGLDDTRYRLYPEYLQKAAELLGADHFSYPSLKAREFYFSGLNLRLQGERSKSLAEKDSLFSLAKSFQEKTLALDSTASFAYNELGLLARRTQQYEQSVTYFNQAVRFSPTWVVPWANLCGSYSELNQQVLAEQCGLKGIALDSTYALTHYNLGFVYFSMDQQEKSAHHFQQTIFYNPNYGDAYVNLGLYHFKKGDYAAAEKIWEEYRKRNPNDKEIYQNLGEAAFKLGKTTEAEAHFLKAISLDAQFKMPFFSQGELYLSKNDLPQSAKWFSEYIKLNPEDPMGYFYLAVAQSPTPTEALTTLETAFKKGFSDLERLKNEARLAGMRKLPAYKKLLKQYFPDKS